MVRKATMKATKKRRPRKVKAASGFDYRVPICNTCGKSHFGPCLDRNFETRTSFALGPLGVEITIRGFQNAQAVEVHAFLSWSDAIEFRDAISNGLEQIRQGKNPGEKEPEAETRYLGMAKVKPEGGQAYD